LKKECGSCVAYEDASKGELLIKGYIQDGDLDEFPAGTPEPYQALGDMCRSKEAVARPSTARILDVLGALKGNQAPPVEPEPKPANPYMENLYVGGRTGSATPTGPYMMHSRPGANPGARNAGTPSQQVDRQAQQNPVRADEVQQLLHHVMRGDLDNVTEMLNTNKALVYGQGDITDLSGRTFRKVTAFQYALWALDKDMWELFTPRYLPKEQAGLQLQALENDRQDIITRHGTHFSFDVILEKYTHYIDSYKGWNWDQRENYWCKEVGGAQRAFPAWLILMMCERGDDVAWTKKDITRRVKRDVTRLAWWFDEKYNNGTLGDQWAAFRGVGGAEAIWSSESRRYRIGSGQGHDQKVSALLKPARLRELATLKVQLYADASSKSNVKNSPGY